jgi:hypothetical protein
MLRTSARFALTGSALVAVGLAQSGYWAPLSFASSPSPRYGAALAYDSVRDRLVMVGGLPNGLNETWENDGATWTLRATTGPSGAAIWYPQLFLSAAYDSQRQCTVVVQCDPSNGNTRTWEWNGSSWLQRTNGNVPTGRDGFALAYDSVRGRTVMFGGKSNAIGHLSDTWEWDGTTWTQRSSGGPSPRKWHAMAFDSVRGVTVLFGGRHDESPYQTFADTWEWNGQYWFQHFGVSAPAARRAHSMAFDAHRGVTVLYGGDNPSSGGFHFSDTWEWNGTQWTNRTATAGTAAWTALAYDSLRRRIVLCGGQTATGQVNAQTLGYTVTPHVAAIQPYGAGCAGPTGVPTLTALGSSVPRLGTTLNLQVGNLPTGLLNLALGWAGFDNLSWGGVALPLGLDPFGFPGCTALLAPTLTYTLDNVGGAASWPLAIPFLPVFAGTKFYVQGGVLVLGWNPGGLVFTRALEATVGR